MAQDKKSFVLYCDWSEIFEQLTDDQAGKLIKHTFRYVNDEDPEIDDPLINMAFTSIKQQLKRDLVKYEGIREKRRISGSKGGVNSGISRSKKQKKASASNSKQTQANEAVSVNVNDTVTVNENVTDIKQGKDDDKKSSAYSLCIDFWLKEFHPGWSFGAVHGVKMKSIIKKIKDLLKVSGRESTDQAIHESFKAVCNNLPEYFLTKDLAMIDSKFNEIIQEIKNGKQGKNDPYKDIIEGVIRQHYT